MSYKTNYKLQSDDTVISRTSIRLDKETRLKLGYLKKTMKMPFRKIIKPYVDDLYEEIKKGEKMKIIKNIPIPKTKSKFEDLLKMGVGDCVEINDRTKFESAKNFLRKHYKIKSKQISYPNQDFVGRIWRVK